MDNTILIKTEGNHSLGLGHVYRTSAVASELAKKRIRVIFVTFDEKEVLPLISSFGYPLIKIDDVDALCDLINQESASVLVIDNMDVSEKFAKEVRNRTKARIVIFGNTSAANKFADVVVNAVIGTNLINCRRFIDTTLYLEGVRYLVLRDEFVNKPKWTRSSSHIRKVLLMFGGSDQANFSYRTLKKLFDENVSWDIDLVMGASFFGESMVRELIEGWHREGIVSAYRNVTNVSDLMLKADFILTSPGTSLFEAFHLGLPAMAFYQTDSQREVFGDFLMCRSFEEIDDLSGEMSRIFTGYPDLARKIADLSLGQGRDEIIDVIINPAS